jgi:group I intron endonuclease
MHYLYKIINQINGKVYIGQTKYLEKRKSQHKTYSTNKHLRNAISKDSWNNFTFEIIDIALNQWQADCIEWCLIGQYDSRNAEKGYNVSPGGYHTEISEETRQKISAAQTGKTHTEETKKKISENNMGKKRTAEAKKNISLAKMGDKNPMYGKAHSEEEKQKISERQKISMLGNTNGAGGKGKTVSEEQKKRHSDIMKSKNNFKVPIELHEQILKDPRSTRAIAKDYGVSRNAIRNILLKYNGPRTEKFKHSEETKKLISEAAKRRWKKQG